MKRSAFEWIRNAYFNSGRSAISSLKQHWNGFDADADSSYVPNLIHQLLWRIPQNIWPNKHYFSFLKFGWNEDRRLNQFSRSKQFGRLSFELGSAHEQFGVWTGEPNFTKKIWIIAYLFFSGKFESYRTNIDVEKTFHVVLLLFSIWLYPRSRRFLSLSKSKVLNLSQLKRPLNKSAL